MIDNGKSSVNRIVYIFETDADVRLAYLFGSQATTLTHENLKRVEDFRTFSHHIVDFLETPSEEELTS